MRFEETKPVIRAGEPVVLNGLSVDQMTYVLEQFWGCGVKFVRTRIDTNQKYVNAGRLEQFTVKAHPDGWADCFIGWVTGKNSYFHLQDLQKQGAAGWVGNWTISKIDTPADVV